MKSELFFIILAGFSFVKSYIKSCNLPQLYLNQILRMTPKMISDHHLLQSSEAFRELLLVPIVKLSTEPGIYFGVLLCLYQIIIMQSFQLATSSKSCL